MEDTKAADYQPSNEQNNKPVTIINAGTKVDSPNYVDKKKFLINQKTIAKQEKRAKIKKAKQHKIA